MPFVPLFSFSFNRGPVDCWWTPWLECCFLSAALPKSQHPLSVTSVRHSLLPFHWHSLICECHAQKSEQKHFVYKYLQNGTTQLPSQEAAINNCPICRSGWSEHNRMLCVSFARFKQWSLKGQCYPQWDGLEIEHLKKRGSFDVWTLPCGSLHLSNSDFIHNDFFDPQTWIQSFYLGRSQI